MKFEEHVQRALDSLPAELARALENVAVVVEDEDPDDPDLFGLWQSHPYLPDKISIFRKPLAASFTDPRELEEEIRITVLHELAHYFGIDEDRLDELGYS
ncbi:MAG TPA: metallopeptidase family protein [Gaiellaceae bacterium]|nr:metallopeptidase family protein [Gaiellaceae bacterium]